MLFWAVISFSFDIQIFPFFLLFLNSVNRIGAIRNLEVRETDFSLVKNTS